MKTTIILTPDQIDQIIKVENDLLLKNKNKSIELIEKVYTENVEKLKSKYKTFDIIIEETKISLIKKEYPELTDKSLTNYFNENMTIKEMAEQSGKSEQQIRLKLKKLNLNLKDRK